MTVPPAPGHDGSRYALVALAREAEALAMAAHGERNDRLNRAAFALSGLIAGGHLDRSHVEQRLAAAALAAGLDRAEARSTIASGLRAGARHPRALPDQADQQRGRMPRMPPPRPLAPSAARPEPEPFSELQPRWRARWAETRSITADDEAGRYLMARGCALPHPRGDLRRHPALRHPSGHVGPTLVGLVTDVCDASRRLNLHFTWITDNGSGEKAAVDRPRRLLWRHLKKGGAVRLWPDDAVMLGLGLAEGVETALSLAKSYAPVWSTIDAGNLASFPYLYPLGHLVIACDHDPAGMRAAAEVTRRWTAAAAERLDDPADFSSWVLLPRKTGTDANDAPRFDFPGAPNPAWDAAIQDESRRLGLSLFGSSARAAGFH